METGEERPRRTTADAGPRRRTAGDRRRTTDDDRANRQGGVVVDVTPDGQTGSSGGERLRETVASMPRQVREELTRRLRRNRRALRKEDVQVVEPPLLRRAVGASALGN